MTPTKASPELVNSLAHSYLTLKAQIAALEAQLQPLRENLIGIALTDGSTPPRSEKTTRLETPEFEINVRQGHTMSVDQARVESVREWLKVRGFSPLFRKLFRASSRYQLACESADIESGKIYPTAELSKKERLSLALLFRDCITVTPNRPALEVKEKGNKEAAS